MKKSTISVVLLVLLFLGSIETFAQKQIVRRVPNEPVVPQKQAKPAKTPTHHAPKKKNSKKKKGGYEYVGEYSDGLAMVQLNGKLGFIDKSGTEVIPCKYDYANPFSEGRAYVKLNGKYGYITPTGIWYDDADKYLHDNLRRVKLNGTWGFIDKSGTEVIPCKYDGAYSFSEGLAKVVLKDEYGFYKFGFIDKSGTEVIPCKYDYAESFREGLAKVKVSGKYGFIDKSGTEVIPCKYDYADHSFHDGRAGVRLNEKYGFVDKSGVETWD